jgi:RNA-binding protein
MLSAQDKRRLKSLAHHLAVIVTVGEQGITDGLRAEAARALADHELIKVRINVTDRAMRRSLGESLAVQCDAEIVQTIGKVCVLYRHNPDADAQLSNVARFS